MRLILSFGLALICIQASAQTIEQKTPPGGGTGTLPNNTPTTIPSGFVISNGSTISNSITIPSTITNFCNPTGSTSGQVCTSTGTSTQPTFQSGTSYAGLPTNSTVTGTDLLAAYPSGGPLGTYTVTNFAHGIGLTIASTNIAVGIAIVNGTQTQSIGVGTGALNGQSSTNSTDNIAFGDNAVGGNGALTTGSHNTGFGTSSLAALTTGSANIAIGTSAGNNITTGSNNSTFGSSSGDGLTTGSFNVCLGQFTCSSNANTGNSNIVIGAGLDVTASGIGNQIDIGGIVFYNNTTAAAPAVTACGTSPSIDSRANNKSGTVTSGSGVLTSCTVTLAGSGYITWNHCRVTPHQSDAGFAYSYTKTVIMVTATSLTSEVFDYDCDGY